MNMKVRQTTVTKTKPRAQKTKTGELTPNTPPRKQAPPERRRFEQLFYRLSTFFLAADASQLDTKIDKGLQETADYFRADRATLWAFSPDGQEISPVYAVVQTGIEPPAKVRLHENLSPAVLDTPPTLADIEKLALRKDDEKSFLAIPLIVADSLRGIFTLAHMRSKYQWHEQDIVQAQRLGEIFAIVLDRKRSQQLLEQRIRFETLISDIAAQFATGSLYAIDREIEYALEQLRVFFDVDHCTIARFSEDGRKLILEYSMQSEEVKLASEYILEDDLPWYFKQLKQGNPVVISGLNDFPAAAEQERQFCRARKVKAFLAFPLLSGSRALGSFVLMSTRGEKQWPAELVERFHGITTVFANVLIRLQTDKVIRASEEFNRSVLASLHYHIAILDRSGLILAVNEAWERFARENGEPLANRIGPGVNYLDVCRRAAEQDDPGARAVLAGIDSVLNGAQERFSLEYPCHSPTEERWFIMRVLPLQGRAGGVVISHANITELKQSQKTLRLREIEFRTMFELSAVGQAQGNPATGRFTMVNKRFCYITGYNEKELLRKTFRDITLPEDRDRDEAEIQRVLNGEAETWSSEKRYIRKDGSIIWVFVNGSLMRDFKGRPYRTVANIVDINERKHAENEIRKRDEFFSEAQRIAHVGSWEWDIATGGLIWSDEVYRIFGWTPQKFNPTYNAFLAAIHPEDRETVKQAVEKSMVDPKKIYSIEHRLLRPDGNERYVHEQGEIHCDKQGNPVRMLGTVLDITESKKAEHALQHAYTEIKQLKDQLEAENIYLRKEIKQEQYGFEEIIGTSDALKYMLYRIKQVAPTDATILIQGETGTGKGLAARALHRISGRKQRRLVNVNCAALPANLIESELFGREKGAFTGAQNRQIGRFELADHGTVFLDEIGELPFDLQAKLLRVIENGEFERLGSPHTVKVDVRIIASTNRNLEEEIKKGRFRQDLYYRLNVFPITMPPLRQRKEDIPLLVEFFAQKYCNRMCKKISSVSKSSLKKLFDYAWPGNIRELENLIERAVIISSGDKLQMSELLGAPSGGDSFQDPSHRSLVEVERAHILKTLKQTDWRIEGARGAARILGLNPSTLRSRMKKMGLQR